MNSMTNQPSGPSGMSPRDAAILIVEDDVDLSFMLNLALQRAGAQAVVVHSAEDAWAAFSADPDRFCLLLTDHDLPGENGAALAMRVRASRPELPILMMTGYTLEAEKLVEPDTIDEWIAKPFRLEMLTTRVKDLVG
jgi:DNA-binding response OmpR family regulator